LGNFPGSKQESALDAFCFRQIQQCTQGFVQLKSPSSKSHDSLLQIQPF
jgi:hypothetical protein